MKTVAVLLSSYNGTRYIKEQIDSILAQENVDVTIFVRDDGSKDGTVDLLRTYDENKVKVFPEENQGVGVSFMRLVYMVPTDFDYYCFSDQDDIWLPEKLSKAVEKLSAEQVPALYASNQLLVDAEGKQYDIRHHKTPATAYEKIMAANQLSGCTFVWNRELHDILVKPEHRPDESFFKVRIHDIWVILIASIAGKVIYDPEGYIKYRIHGNNEVGTSERKKNLDKLKSDYRNMFVKKNNRYRSATCKEVILHLPEYLSEERTVMTRKYYEYLTNGKIKRELLFVKKPFFLGENEKLWKYRFKILFNLW